MSYQLFAFQLAEPMQSGPTSLDSSYDPTTQTSTWESDGSVFAAATNRCSRWHHAGYCCNSYGSYCNTWHCVDNGRPYVCVDA